MTARTAPDSQTVRGPDLASGKGKLAANPVPLKGEDCAEAVAGQHQQADDGAGLRAIRTRRG